MNGVPTSASSGAALPARLDASVTEHLFTGLERFWPSRRGHAFDEFCR
jgi:hypothetical protein